MFVWYFKFQNYIIERLLKANICNPKWCRISFSGYDVIRKKFKMVFELFTNPNVQMTIYMDFERSSFSHLIEVKLLHLNQVKSDFATTIYILLLYLLHFDMTRCDLRRQQRLYSNVIFKKEFKWWMLIKVDWHNSNKKVASWYWITFEI